ncbi:uncharacterized protein [Physcomitrium patens]|uniref:Uncharacterized protein n=2 Tax=Physcomitrium patens TaxID=3218 RepID=A0A2K1L7L9_PHYPA|nr:uncharacterized protein LOC112278769 [Physcomitrium patens]PNR61994.1 hypothetical protein PHYPA_000418 [Physcomitrium patens]|eukprot:XP_024368286.1 uncharacterized protein LOC112278769 [Physcomitrella patens]
MLSIVAVPLPQQARKEFGKHLLYYRVRLFKLEKAQAEEEFAAMATAVSWAMSVLTSVRIEGLPKPIFSRDNEGFRSTSMQCFALRSWNRHACQEVQISGLKLGVVSGGRIRVRDKFCVGMALSGEGVGGVENLGTDAAVWLRENLPLHLEKDGVDVDLSKRIAEACADACVRILATGRSFDPMMIMDAMEEEVERRDLRGDDILPFEIGRKAAKVLTQRWNELPLGERPKNYHHQLYINKKDVVDFDKWPKNLNLP